MLVLALVWAPSLAGLAGVEGQREAAWFGSLVAWAIQSVSYWRVAGALRRGTSALRDWALGMAARALGLAVLWAAVGWADAAGRAAVVAYALSMVGFLLLEAAWLWAQQTRTPS